jgi:hypothetical protein
LTNTCSKKKLLFVGIPDIEEGRRIWKEETKYDLAFIASVS